MQSFWGETRTCCVILGLVKFRDSGVLSYSVKIKGLSHGFLLQVKAVPPGIRTIEDAEGFVPVFPQRPGGEAPECDFYLRTGHCKFGDGCRFHHPLSAAVKLTRDGGYPLRPGQPVCPFYDRTGAQNSPIQLVLLSGKDDLDVFDVQCRRPYGSMPRARKASDMWWRDLRWLVSCRLPDVDDLAVWCVISSLKDPMAAVAGMCKYAASCKFHHPAKPNSRSNGNGLHVS